MGRPQDFEFGSGSVAEAYENDLVPVLFEPWARLLLDRCPDWNGRRVLDLGAGTGIVTRLLLQRVGTGGHVVAADMNPEMLSQARLRCAGSGPAVQFVHSAADALDIADGSVDVVVCQQAFQFFPDKRTATQEIHRVLREEGRVLISTWCPVSECEYFGAVCDALSSIGEAEIADTMRLPFDFMPESELSGYFSSSGFTEVEVTVEELPLVLPGGQAQAIKMPYATPIGPKLQALSDEQQGRFGTAMAEKISNLSRGGTEMGHMSAHVLSALKP